MAYHFWSMKPFILVIGFYIVNAHVRCLLKYIIMFSQKKKPMKDEFIFLNDGYDL